MSTLRPHPLVRSGVFALALGAAACGPIDLGSSPVVVEVTSINAGDQNGDGSSPLLIGESQTVRVEVTSRSQLPQRGVAVTLVLRRGGEMVDAAETVISRRTLAIDLDAGARATFELGVTLLRGARPGEWSVSARADATTSRGGPWEADPPRRQVWRVSAPPVNVGAFAPRRTFALPYPSLNADCPLELVAQVSNDGASDARLEVTLTTDPPALAGFIDGAFTTTPPAPLLAGQRASMSVFLEPRLELPAGTRAAVRLHVSAEIPNRRPPLALAVAEANAQGIEVVASGSRLQVAAVRLGSADALAPRGGSLEVIASVVYRPEESGAASVDDPRVVLRVVRDGALLAWEQRPDAGNPNTLDACPEPRLDECVRSFREYRFALTVPNAEAPGPVRIEAVVLGTERLPAPRPAVELCGTSDPGVPGRSVVVEVSL